MYNKIILAFALLVGCNNLMAQSSFTLWYEYGNGNFLSQSFSDADALDNFIQNNLPQSTASDTVKAPMKVTPIYKPPKMPTNKRYAFNYLPVTFGEGFPNTSMPENERLYIYNSTRDFLANDTVFLSLCYNKTNLNAKKLAFFYNSNVNAAFKPILETANPLIMPNANGALTASVPQIRTHNSESISIANGDLLTSAGEGFSDGLLFDLSNSSSDAQNIMLTLFTYGDIPIEANETFKLVFLDNNNNPLLNKTSEIINHSGLKSHDPNYEKVVPECLEVATAVGQTLHYDVHFQNIGLGPALTVETTTTLPDGYTINDIINRTNLEWLIAKQIRNDNYIVDMSKSHDNLLIINFKKKPSTTIVLKGTLGMPNPLENITTMGDFSFEMKVKPPIKIGDLTSKTSIIFDTNEPVVTDEAIVRIRKCCTCSEKSNNSADNNKPKKCKTKNKFLQWLLCKDC